MAKRTSRYARMTASQLAQETRARGLQKPDVLNISEWADFLEAEDRRTGTASAADEALSPPTSDGAVGGSAPAAEDYNALSKEDAIAEAERRGMARTSKTTKQEAVDFLLASDGVSEDEQAEADAE